MLMSGVSPGGLPPMPQYGQYGIQAPDLMGMVGSNYGAQAGRSGAKKGGMGQAIGGALPSIISDRRLKENIRRIGEADNGLPIYAYNFPGDPTTHIGFMADEVKEVHPEAVQKMGFSDFEGVDYGRAVQPRN